MTKREHIIENLKNLSSTTSIIDDTKQQCYYLADVYKALHYRGAYNKFYRTAIEALGDTQGYKHIWRKKGRNFDTNSPFIRVAKSDKVLMRRGYRKGVLLNEDALDKITEAFLNEV